ncbi:hypothetical protein B0T18DRAFT_388001 [Schizothecium vesticola]|uniref:Uncharacterized protein n=1 Tax=Schizothecium vesticola TaxID=314040 RepID=A0AA40KAJ0_9PEZI|nr:hypothetical protein B0T18DRAFT_388001 [Schizothecium vesticola]
MPPPMTPGQGLPTTTNTETAAVYVLKVVTILPSNTTTTIWAIVTLTEDPALRSPTSTTTGLSSSTIKTSATNPLVVTTPSPPPNPIPPAAPEAIQIIDNEKFGIPLRVGSLGDDSGPPFSTTPAALSVLAPRDDTVVCVRPFGVPAACCWDIVERRRTRRRERELELQERLWGAAVGAEVAGTCGGSPG